MKGNGDTFLSVTSVTSVTKVVTLHSVRYTRVLKKLKLGRGAMCPTFETTYLTADRPQSPPSMLPRFLRRGNTLRRLSLAQDHPDRPRARALAAARQLPEHLPALEPGAERAAVLDRKYERACG